MNKEIIVITNSHGLIQNTDVFSFDKKVCSNLLGLNLNEDSKREFMQCLFLKEFLNKFFKKCKEENQGLNYGVTIKVFPSALLTDLNVFYDVIKNKIYGKIKFEEINKNIELLENILNINTEFKDGLEYKNIKELMLSFSQEIVHKEFLDSELLINKEVKLIKKI